MQMRWTLTLKLSFFEILSNKLPYPNLGSKYILKYWFLYLWQTTTTTTLWLFIVMYSGWLRPSFEVMVHSVLEHTTNDWAHTCTTVVFCVAKDETLLWSSMMKPKTIEIFIMNYLSILLLLNNVAGWNSASSQTWVRIESQSMQISRSRQLSSIPIANH